MFAVGILAYCLYQRNSRKNVVRKRDQSPYPDIQNYAYEPELSLRRQPATYSEGSYETPVDYAQLANSLRLNDDNHYEALTFKGKTEEPSYNNDDYTQLNSQREQADGSYATLNMNSEGGNTSDTSAPLSRNQESNELVYVELS